MPVATRVRNLRVLPYAGCDGRDVRESGGRSPKRSHELDGDVVVVDLGAGNRDDLYDFFATRALRLLVTSRDRPALEATYAFLKSAARRAERRARRDAPGRRSRSSRAAWSETGSAAPEEAETFHAFSRLVREHLGIPLPVVGCLRSSERIPQSIAARQPLVARRGLDDNVRAFHQMAEWVLTGAAAPRAGVRPRRGEAISRRLGAAAGRAFELRAKAPALSRSTGPRRWSFPRARPRSGFATSRPAEPPWRPPSRCGSATAAVLHLDQLDGQPPLAGRREERPAVLAAASGWASCQSGDATGLPARGRGEGSAEIVSVDHALTRARAAREAGRVDSR